MERVSFRQSTDDMSANSLASAVEETHRLARRRTTLLSFFAMFSCGTRAFHHASPRPPVTCSHSFQVETCRPFSPTPLS